MSFDRRQTTSLYWFNNASDLHASAGALWLSTEANESERIVTTLMLGSGFDMAVAVPPVFRMLCGLSLELIYKAILVEDKVAVPPTHKLRALAKRARIATTDREAGLLDILTEAIEWHGRYPVPIREEKVELLRKLSLEHLFDRVPLGKVNGYRANGALSWEGYEKLWIKPFKVYWERRESSAQS